MSDNFMRIDYFHLLQKKQRLKLYNQRLPRINVDFHEYLKNGWNVGAIRKENYVSGFAGSKTKEKMKDGLMFGAMSMGSGSLVVMATDPIFRSFRESGKMLFANAVFMVE